MAKIAYNACHGGFALSSKAVELGKSLSGDKNWGDENYWPDNSRHDPILIQVIETLGERANTRFSYLAIEEVPSGSLYRIDEYDGKEAVMTQDDYEWVVAP